MKRIILAVLLAAMLSTPALAAKMAAGKVLLVEVDGAGYGAPTPSLHLDFNLRMRAAIQTVLAKRGIRHEEYYWKTGNVDTLKAKLTSGNYKFAIIYGGNGTGPSLSSGGTNIRRFWGCDSTYSTTDALVWYAADPRHSTSTHAYVNGAMGDADATDRWVSTTDTFFVVRGHTSIIDSFIVSKQNANISNAGAKRDTTITTMTVTPIIEKVNSTARFMTFWRVRYGTHKKYYLGLRDANGIFLVDALLCKYFPDARPIEYCLTLDDFGMIRQDATSSSGGSHYPYPNSATKYPSDFFTTDLGGFFDLIRSYNSKLTIGTSMMNLRAYHADSSQWQGWKSCYDTFIGPYYGNNFALVWHDHGFNSPADSIQLTFEHIGSYNDWQAKRSRRTVYAADIDSLYGVWQDTIASYGMRSSPGIIPPADKQAGHYGTTSFANTLLDFCAIRNQPLRAMYNRDVSITRYPSINKYRGASAIHEWYCGGADSTNATLAELVTYNMHNLGALLYLNLYDAYDVTNSGYTRFFRQSNRSFPLGYYSGRTAPVIVFHAGRLLKKGPGTTADYQAARSMLKHLAFFDAIAGRQIYRPVFMHEFDWKNLVQ